MVKVKMKRKKAKIAEYSQLFSLLILSVIELKF